MTSVDIECFRLIDPPEGIEQTVRATLAAIDYPWERLQPYLKQSGHDAVGISCSCPEWMPNTTTGYWDPATCTIYLGTQFTGWQDHAPFV